MKMNSDPVPPSSSKVAFSFSRKIESKLVQSVIAPVEAPEAPKRQLVTSINDLLSPADSDHTDFDSLVIPLIKRNTYAPLLAKSVTPAALPVSSDDAAAAAAILEDAQRFQGTETKIDSKDDGVTEIPLWMQNKLPEGFETDARLDVALRAEESSLEDYDRIPVEAYGMAMLRGMGWKADEGIGLRNKQVTKPVEVLLRPRGLGLGATPVKERKKEGRSGEEKDEKEKVIAVGGYVSINSGRHQNRTGKVTAMDNEAGRYIVVLVGEEKRSVSIAGAALEVISEKEYNRSTRYINNDKYYDHKIVEEVTRTSEKSDKRSRDDKDRRREERRRRSRSRSTDHKRRRRSRS
ncbi:G-patch domain and KOW motifs-containing protein-like [Paramacrobiotus metropolitanus]|uniref:G-patch domain and KOW motifs-containing protein-like n=1 Tax=Paramacrobiotus metropolitanus TaxID=2943436 RepID=UPI002445C143|nr:G-patch domain and KOW motifs-containing protein-like [Paramacrobiotus metropolitanus]